jgi:hypothetical protein
MSVHNVSPIKPKATGFGYKVYKVLDGGKLESSFMEFPMPRRTWVKAEVEAGMHQAGFHIYLQREKAEQNVLWHERLWSKNTNAPIYKVFKVKYREAKIQGIGDGGYTDNARVVVADEIFVIY